MLGVIYTRSSRSLVIFPDIFGDCPHRSYTTLNHN